MKKTVQLLMVDDHPFILQAYRNTLDRFKPDEYEVVSSSADSGKTGYEAIVNSPHDFDVALLDISIPGYAEKNVESGLDLARLLRERMPACKVVLLTMHTEKMKFRYFSETIQPDGLVIKNDLTFEELLLAFEKILAGEKYYSESVLNIINMDEPIV
ncbi:MULTISPECIES: response regulator transcription factor [unclassified Flavobacterium]|uniref:response regulator n=1 Tax=unclassified Flavobacterium TaxID=196869 RepID=UPI001F12A8B0|nr:MULTISPECIES: response regulator [unclassified Flavobacterium]UMY66518.1 response regulator [Flavobacterium sp. HJ-32-4]